MPSIEHGAIREWCERKVLNKEQSAFSTEREVLDAEQSESSTWAHKCRARSDPDTARNAKRRA